jgi:hypothetical protein
MRNTLQVSTTFGLVACLALVAACDKKRGGTATPGAATVASSSPNKAAEEVWADLASGEQPRVVAAWRRLAQADAALLRSATYSVAAPPNDELRIGSLAIRMDTSTLKSWDGAFVEAFPGGVGQDAARACVALDQLAAGVMESGPRFAPLAKGVRAFAYEQAVLVRMFALSKLNTIDPRSPHDPVGTRAKLQDIARSGEIARAVP